MQMGDAKEQKHFMNQLKLASFPQLNEDRRREWLALQRETEIDRRVKSIRCDHCHEKTSVALVKTPSAYSFNP